MAINGTMELINSITVGAGGQPTIEFTNISQAYNDLVIVVSARGTSNSGNAQNFFAVRPNGSTSGYTYRRLLQDGNSIASDTAVWIFMPSSLATSNVFGSCQIHISNYKTSSDKFILSESIQETNSTSVNNGLHSILWANSAPITSIQLTSVINSNGSASTFAENSTAYLYGITNVPSGAKSTGGVITEDSTHWYHTFTSSGTFTPTQSISADILVIAGGGSGGGQYYSGGGGAGGVQTFSSQSLTSQNYTITVGAGGASTTIALSGNNGSNSQFGSLSSATGGGGGGNYSSTTAAQNGGSGGGSGGDGGGGGSLYGTAGTGSAGQGNNGGRGWAQGSGMGSGGGGGGFGSVGSNGSASAAGAGGSGLTSYSSWASATSTGVSGNYAGGGGGACFNVATAGTASSGGGAGGRQANGTAGTVNTGGGGGGGGDAGTSSGAGGSGIVIVRYAK